MSAVQAFPRPGLNDPLGSTEVWGPTLQPQREPGPISPAVSLGPGSPAPSSLSHFEAPLPPLPLRLRPKVLLTIPVHNEVRFIRTTIEALDLTLSQSGIDYVLSVAEDGSIDGTKDILRRLRQDMPDLVLRMEPEKLGRGKALRDFWQDMEADFYAFCDTDLATDPDTLVSLLRRALSGNDIVVGSRYAEGAIVRRPPVRAWVSRIYNWYVRKTFRDGILDHQCGLKIFSRKVVDELLNASKEDSWFWDTEILVRARQQGYHVEEVPVAWVEKKAKRTSYRRLFSDIGLHGSGLLRLKGDLSSTPSAPARAPHAEEALPAEALHGS